VEDSDDDFETLNFILKDHNEIALSLANSVREAMQVLEQGNMVLSYYFAELNTQLSIPHNLSISSNACSLAPLLLIGRLNWKKLIGEGE